MKQIPHQLLKENTIPEIFHKMVQNQNKVQFHDHYTKWVCRLSLRNTIIWTGQCTTQEEYWKERDIYTFFATEKVTYFIICQNGTSWARGTKLGKKLFIQSFGPLFHDTLLPPFHTFK